MKIIKYHSFFRQNMKSAIAMIELMGLHNLSTLTADRSIFDNGL